MNQVIPYQLWLGHAGDGRDSRQIHNAGINALVQLAAEEPPLPPSRELTYCRFPLLDGSGNEPTMLYLAVHMVANLLRWDVPTLVCCGGGMSRSPAIAAAALAVVRQTPPEDCLRLVAHYHCSDVSPGLWKEIVRVLASMRLVVEPGTET
jgi:hypothetical protein